MWIKDILAGAYIKEEGTKPNHVLLPDGSRVARANLVGVVVSVNLEGLPTFVLDDGTGKVTVRAFEPSAQMAAVQVGDAVLVIGRPRQFNAERYVLPEIVRKLPDLGWLDVRKSELGAVQTMPKAVASVPQAVVEEVVDDAFGLAENVMGAIRALDQGDGADTDAVIAQANAKDSEKTVQFLLRNGDIFEVSPGKLKVLE